VLVLMRKQYGREHLTKFAEDCGIGLGTAGRIKKQETSVGLMVLDKIADRFNLSPWMLLVPGMDPNNPPALKPVNEKERMLYERIMAAAKVIASEPDSSKYL
jgi:transcriptional regulator with XRE-family HTH domain